jgi:hypothetical protein
MAVGIPHAASQYDHRPARGPFLSLACRALAPDVTERLNPAIAVGTTSGDTSRY